MHDNQRQAVIYAYIAGLIDGEGSICITKDFRETTIRNSKLKNPRYLPLVRIGMIQKKPLEFIQNAFGVGKLYNELPRKDRPTCRLMYRWTLTNQKYVLQVLDKIMPYLIVKKKQAELVYDLCINWKTPIDKQKGTDPEEVQRRENLFQKVRKLNAVGLAAATTNPSNTGDGEVIV